MFIYARKKPRHSLRSPRQDSDILLITRWLYPPPIVRRALEAKKYDKDIVIYSVTFIMGSPRAVEISAMDFSVRLGKPDIHRDMAAIFSLNHSCLFLIANVMSSIPDRSFFFSNFKNSENRVNAQVN